MIKIFKNLFNKGKNVSVLKKLMNNPDMFIATIEVVNNEIKISIKEKEKENGTI